MLLQETENACSVYPAVMSRLGLILNTLIISRMFQGRACPAVKEMFTSPSLPPSPRPPPTGQGPTLLHNNMCPYLAVRDPFVYPTFANKSWKSSRANVREEGHQLHSRGGGQAHMWRGATKQPLKHKKTAWRVWELALTQACKANLKVPLFGSEKKHPSFPALQNHKCWQI